MDGYALSAFTFSGFSLLTRGFDAWPRVTDGAVIDAAVATRISFENTLISSL